MTENIQSSERNSNGLEEMLAGVTAGLVGGELD